MSVPNTFEDALRRFDKVARDSGILYAVIGGIAVILQGHPRATNDIDATVWDVDRRLDEFLASLEQSGIRFRIQEGLAFARLNRVLLLSTEYGIELDVSMGALPFEEQMVRSAERHEVGENLSLPVAKPADLIVMKLVAGRPRDMMDARMLVVLYPEVDKAWIAKTVTEFAEALDQPEIIETMKSVLE